MNQHTHSESLPHDRLVGRYDPYDNAFDKAPDSIDTLIDSLPQYEPSEEEKQTHQALHYQPFDAEFELESIRDLWPEQLALPPEEQHKIIKERIDHFKQQLQLQREGIATTITTLYDTIRSTPDVSQDDLWHIVTQAAPACRLNPHQFTLFHEALEKYTSRHQAIAKYRHLYPDDARLFEACFGEMPSGKVDVVQGPMTLMFRCWNQDDYTLAYANGSSMPDTSRAKLSAGAALPSGGLINELAGTLTIQNGESLQRKATEIIKTNEDEIEGEEAQLFLHMSLATLEIRTKQGTVWTIHKEAIDPSEGEYRIVVKKVGTDDSRFDCVIRENGVMPYGQNHEVESVRYQEDTFSIMLEPLFMEIRNKTDENVAFTITSVLHESLDEFDDTQPDTTRIHEDQHQFNALFTPLELQTLPYQIIEQAIKRDIPAEEALQQLTHDLVRFERQTMGIDSRARDEIIAYYADGREPKNIFEMLHKSKLYNYRTQYADAIERIPDKIQMLVENEIDILATNGALQPIKIDPHYTLTAIQEVFGEEYVRDLQRWTSALTALEAKGYNRQEIIMLCYQEPVYRWTSMARRAPAKATSTSETTTS